MKDGIKRIRTEKEARTLGVVTPGSLSTLRHALKQGKPTFIGGPGIEGMNIKEMLKEIENSDL